MNKSVSISHIEAQVEKGMSETLRDFETLTYPPSLELVWFTGLFLSLEPTVQPELHCAIGNVS